MSYLRRIGTYNLKIDSGCIDIIMNHFPEKQALCLMLANSRSSGRWGRPRGMRDLVAMCRLWNYEKQAKVQAGRLSLSWTDSPGLKAVERRYQRDLELCRERKR